jgi:putative membrane protein
MTKRTFANLALTALLGLSLAAAANDVNKRDTQAPKVMGPKGEQTKLVHKMHHANVMEIEMGGLAQRNGASDAVKRYGQMLVEDHKKADVDLLNVASKMGISMAEPGKPAGRADGMGDKHEKMEQPDAKTPPRDMNDKARSDGMRGSGGDAMADKGRVMKDGEMRDHKMMMKTLETLKGPEFDRQFLTMMIRDHQKDIDEAKRGRAAMRGQDELARLIDQQLPVLQKHLDTAQATLKNMKQ